MRRIGIGMLGASVAEGFAASVGATLPGTPNRMALVPPNSLGLTHLAPLLTQRQGS